MGVAKPLGLYLVTGVGGGFSPNALLVAANSAPEANEVAVSQSVHLAAFFAVSLDYCDDWPGKFDGEWEEPLDSPSGPRVLAEYYA